MSGLTKRVVQVFHWNIGQARQKRWKCTVQSAVRKAFALILATLLTAAP